VSSSYEGVSAECEGVLRSIHMGWLRLVGSLNHRSLLQNITSFIGLFYKKDQ